jgi:hypothetical protein
MWFSSWSAKWQRIAPSGRRHVSRLNGPMVCKRSFLTTLPMPLLAIVGVGFASYAFHTKSNDLATGSGNTSSCAQAQLHLREADRCLGNALQGLSQVGNAKEQCVLGDRRLAPKYIERIGAIREHLHRVCEEADDALAGVFLPELNQSDEDEVPPP